VLKLQAGQIMRHYPIYLDTRAQRIVVSGAGECALAKLRLLIKTEAQIAVFGADVDAGVEALADAGRITLHRRAVETADFEGARLAYAANDDAALDGVAAVLARAAGVLLNWVDDLGESQFITPAIVDRDPVVIAIGTEGAAPVLARQIKADLEQRLPESLGILARIGQGFRRFALALPEGRARRDFWARYYGGTGADALAQGGEAAVKARLQGLLAEQASTNQRAAHVDFIPTSAADLLTLRSQRKLDAADVVVHDAGVVPEILELARREARIVPVLHDNADLAALAQTGVQIVRLIAGDAPHPVEVAALRRAQISHALLPGVAQPHARNITHITEVRRHG